MEMVFGSEAGGLALKLSRIQGYLEGYEVAWPAARQNEGKDEGKDEAKETPPEIINKACLVSGPAWAGLMRKS